MNWPTWKFFKSKCQYLKYKNVTIKTRKIFKWTEIHHCNLKKTVMKHNQLFPLVYGQQPLKHYTLCGDYQFRGIQEALTSITPGVLRLISSVFMLCVLLCNRLATSLTTLSLVFPTGGSRAPHVVFITFLCWIRRKEENPTIIKQNILYFTKLYFLLKDEIQHED